MVLQFVGEYVVAFLREPQPIQVGFCFYRNDAVRLKPWVVAFLRKTRCENSGFFDF